MIVTVKDKSGAEATWTAGTQDNTQLRKAVQTDANWKGFEVVKLVRQSLDGDIDITVA